MLIKNFKYIFSGQFLAPALYLLFSPIISKIFTPIDFSIVSFFLLFAGPIASVATLKFDSAIMRSRSSNLANKIFVISIKSVLFISLLCFLVSTSSLYLLKKDHYLIFGILLMIYVTSAASYDIFSALAIRKSKNIKNNFFGRVILGVSILTFQILLGSLFGGAFSLILATILGYLCSVVYLSYSLRLFRHKIVRHVNFKSIFNRNYQDVFFGSQNTLLASLELNLPSVLIAIFLSPTLGGTYFFMQKIIFNPLILLNTVFAQTFIPWLSNIKNNIKLSKPIYALFLILIPAIIFLPFFHYVTPIIFHKFFGGQWNSAGNFASYLILFLPLKVLLDFTLILFVAINKQRVVFFTKLLVFLATTTPIFFLKNLNADSFFKILSLGNLALYSILLLYIFSQIKILRAAIVIVILNLLMASISLEFF